MQVKRQYTKKIKEELDLKENKCVGFDSWRHRRVITWIGVVIGLIVYPHLLAITGQYAPNGGKVAIDIMTELFACIGTSITVYYGGVSIDDWFKNESKIKDSCDGWKNRRLMALLSAFMAYCYYPLILALLGSLAPNACKMLQASMGHVYILANAVMGFYLVGQTTEKIMQNRSIKWSQQNKI